MEYTVLHLFLNCLFTRTDGRVKAGTAPDYDVFLLEAAAGIAQWYRAGLQAGCSGVRVPAGAANFSPHHRVQTGAGAHPAS
jgi:hypothetical protein